MDFNNYFFKKGFINLFAYKESFPIIIELLIFLDSLENKDHFIIQDTNKKAIAILANLASGYNEFNKIKKQEFYRFARSLLSSIQSNLLILIELNIVSKSETLEKINKLDYSLKFFNGVIKKIEK
jgi:hypothetical protein